MAILKRYEVRPGEFQNLDEESALLMGLDPASGQERKLFSTPSEQLVGGKTLTSRTTILSSTGMAKAGFLPNPVPIPETEPVVVASAGNPEAIVTDEGKTISTVDPTALIPRPEEEPVTNETTTETTEPAPVPETKTDDTDAKNKARTSTNKARTTKTEG